jgi:N-acyl-D-aspartate/D-glutamate deacylase
LEHGPGESTSLTLLAAVGLEFVVTTYHVYQMNELRFLCIVLQKRGGVLSPIGQHLDEMNSSILMADKRVKIESRTAQVYVVSPLTPTCSHPNTIQISLCDVS